MTNEMNRSRSVLITGAGGYIGRLVVEALATDRRKTKHIIAVDLRLPEKAGRLPGVEYVSSDIRSPEIGVLLQKYSADTVVHLAAIVTPGKMTDRDEQYSVDVLGTDNVLECCRKAGVKQLVLTSSGAAYGYHADNPDWLSEDDALRGNPEFAYSDHKRLVEEKLQQWRETHPELKQLIFRPGAILGATTRNQITALFERRVIIGLLGAEIPFTFIWDQDVVNCIVKGVHEQASGIFNLAGGGRMRMQQIAQCLGKVYLPLPIWLVTSALWLLQKIGLTQYGPEQVMFLRYRPVLCNRKLKEQFGYVPHKTSKETFEHFLTGGKSLQN